MTNMTQTQPPSGWTLANFKAVSLDCGQWLWGLAEGSFNDKMSTSQIIVDALIGCLPLVGDATALRDLVATSIGLCEDPKKREDVWEWALLGVLVLALIPVFGGIIKGVGRLVIRFARAVAKLTGVARAAKLAEAAKGIIKVLNHFKFKGGAEAWFLKLRFALYKDDMIRAADEFTGRMIGALDSIKGKLGSKLPEAMLNRINALKGSMSWLRVEFRKHVPEVIQQLDAHLREIQSYVRAGGETTSRTVAHEVTTGEKNITYTQEARLYEEPPPALRSARGGWKQNPDDDAKAIAKVYQHEPGYPDLLAYPKNGKYTDIAAFSGRIRNEELDESKKLFRMFGPADDTLGVEVRESHAGGDWWGVGNAPATPEAWRGPSAVLDEWNRDGYGVTAELPKGANIKAAVGKTSEQVSEKIPGQYLPGGGEQAVIHLPKSTREALSAAGKRVMNGGRPEVWVDPETGITFTVSKTGWADKDVNGAIGYRDVPGPGTVSTHALGEREIADKKYKDNAP